MGIKSHKDLVVWNLAMDYVVLIYKAVHNFPQEEKFGLSLQMRRCAVSIPSNIAEGAARYSIKEYVHFLHIALGSLSELETQIEISNRLMYISDTTDLMDWNHKIRSYLVALIRSLRSKLVEPHVPGHMSQVP